MDAGDFARVIAEQIDAEAPGVPRYRRLMRAIEREIAAGRLRQGAALPGERGLAEALGVSRVTVRKALDGLENAGLVLRRHGARTEVNTRVEKTLSTLTSFSEDMLARGIAPGFRWVSREAGRATPAEATALGLAPGAPVWRLARVRTGDGRPIARELSTVPAGYLDGLELIDGSLYRTLAARGAQPVRAVQRLRAVLPDAADRAELECAETTPVLEVERRCFLAGGEAVEFSHTRYRADVYDFVVELHR